MPELPEVETVMRALRPHVEGSIISSARALSPTLRAPLPQNISELISSRQIIAIKRRAKYLLFELSGGLTMVIHLGMTGSLTITSKPYIPIKHDHVIIDLEGKLLVYNDPRRFGLISLIETHQLPHHKLMSLLGPEPLEHTFTTQSLMVALRGRNKPIKTAMMDNRVMVGVGNIYASEALFLSGIIPTKKAGILSASECDGLVKAIKKVLQEAIDSGGSSIRDFVSIDRIQGHFQHNFAVYGKDGEPCRKCLGYIVKIYQSGRSTFYCLSCQA